MGTFFKKYRTLLLSVMAIVLLSGVTAGMLMPGRNAHQAVRQVAVAADASEPGVETAAPTASEQDARAGRMVRIVFGGDMMFDRYIRTAVRKYGNDFVLANVRERLGQADAVVANLEGPITTRSSVSETSLIGERLNYVFTFDPSWAATLYKNNVRVVNIGNNHILNFGSAGLAETREFLSAAGVGFFGDPDDPAHRFLVRDIAGVRVGFVNYDQFVADGEAKALEDIRSVRTEADVVVAYTHWGREYEPATEDEKRLARGFVDAGADAVIGSHPHVVQESEDYRGKRIYYSLGNFVFDQYFRPETTQGLLVEASIDPGTKHIGFQEIFVTLKQNGQTVITDKTYE